MSMPVMKKRMAKKRAQTWVGLKAGVHQRKHRGNFKPGARVPPSIQHNRFGCLITWMKPREKHGEVIVPPPLTLFPVCLFALRQSTAYIYMGMLLPYRSLFSAQDFLNYCHYSLVRTCPPVISTCTTFTD